MIPQIKFKLLHPDAKLPVRAHDTDAAFDVVATSRTIEDGYIKYGMGFSTEIPTGWMGYFYPRSSIYKYDLVLANSVGVIDAEYRGEWEARFKYLPHYRLGAWTGHTAEDATDITFIEGQMRYDMIYEVGERIGQIQFRQLDQYELVLTDELNDTTRGAGGFGSTGK